MNWQGSQSCPAREYASAGRAYRVRIYVLDENIIRVRYAIGDFFEEWPSYGVSPDFAPTCCDIREFESDLAFELKTPTVKIRINKETLGVEFVDAETDLTLSKDVEGLDYAYNDWTGDYKIRVRKEIRPNEYFYGLGDKPSDLNLRGKRYEMWGADHYAFKENSDPLYKNIPFFLSLFNGNTYGIFFDNTSRSHFDFGLHSPGELSIEAEGGQMDYYFFRGDTPLDVIASYTKLSGLPPMPPMWALGYHQSKWSYYPDVIVKDIAEEMREHKIPCDSIHLDIHHMDNYRSFTWSSDYFPNPKQLMDELNQQGFHTVIIVNPGIKIDVNDPVWNSGMSADCYCRRHDGALMEGIVWPGNCHFPDFTNPAARAWWIDTMESQIADIGISGIWNDMNEPAIFPDKTFPMDTRHFYDGRPCSHSKAHNVYGHCMASASREAFLKHGKGKRPFNLSRSGFAGLQRFAATWTGDNCSTWEHLRMANFQCQRLASSGVSFAGSDAGGFLEFPTPELFCRWMQMAAFHVFFRNHSSGEYGGQEPWAFGEHVMRHVRHAIEQRYMLLPYFYTQFHLYSTQGLPMIRSLALQCHKTDDTYWRGVEFFLGDHIYVVPILHAYSKGASLYVPPGLWYSLWDDTPIGPAYSDAWVDSSINCIPVFVRGGAVIPRWPIQQYVGEMEKPTLYLDLWWAPATRCASRLYEDACDGMEYLDGEYSLHEFDYEAAQNGFTLTRRQSGNGGGFHGETILRLHALPEECRMLTVTIDGVNGQNIALADDICEISLPDSYKVVEIALKGL